MGLTKIMDRWHREILNTELEKNNQRGKYGDTPFSDDYKKGYADAIQAVASRLGVSLDGNDDDE